MNDIKNNIILLSDFTPFPGVRYKDDKPKGDTGAEFRKNVLIPALKKHDKIVVNLDTGVKKSILPSFLEESFAGISRDNKWSLDDFNQHIKIETEDEEYLSDIEFYVKNCER